MHTKPFNTKVRGNALRREIKRVAERSHFLGTLGGSAWKGINFNRNGIHIEPSNRDVSTGSGMAVGTVRRGNPTLAPRLRVRGTHARRKGAASPLRGPGPTGMNSNDRQRARCCAETFDSSPGLQHSNRGIGGIGRRAEDGKRLVKGRLACPVPERELHTQPACRFESCIPRTLSERPLTQST